MGIRIALGADGKGLTSMVLGGSMITAAVGTSLGMLGALWASRLLARFLFGVQPSDPLTYGAVGTLVVGVCLVASWVPARRATRVDPVEVLSAE